MTKIKAPVCISRLLLLFLFHTVSGVDKDNIKYKSKTQNIHIYKYETFE